MANPVLDKSKDVTDDVQFVDEFYRNGTDSRIKKEVEWKFCKLFLEGYQNVTYRKDLGALFNPPASNNKKRIIYNKIKPKVWEFVSLLNSNPTQYETVPYSNDDDAIVSSEYIKRILPYVGRVINNDELNVQLDADVATYGVAYKLALWNDLIGTVSKGVYSGELYSEILTPFEVLKQSGVKKLRDSKRIMILKLRSKEWISEKFPKVDIKEIIAADETGVTDTHRSLEVISKIEQTAKNITEDKKFQSGNILVKALLELPSEKYHKGRLLVVAGNTILSDEELPYKFMQDDGKWNIFEYRYNPLDNSEYPKGMVIDLIEPQMTVNNMASFGYENTKLTAKSKLILPDNSGVKDGDINSENNIIRYTPTSMGHTPNFISGNALGNDYMSQIELANDSIAEISNIGKALSGESIKNVRSASHFAMFQEVDMRKISLYAIHKEKNEADFIECVVKIMRERYSKNRLIEITGDDSQIEIDKFKRDIINFKTIYPIRGSSIPESKAAQNEFLFGLAQTGMIDPQLLLQNIGFGDYKRTIDYKAVDIQNALREDMAIKDGLPADFKPYDNHAIHFPSHEYTIKTESFKKISNLPMQVVVELETPAREEGGKPTIEKFEVGEITREQYMQYHIERHHAPLRRMMEAQNAQQQNGSNSQPPK